MSENVVRNEEGFYRVVKGFPVIDKEIFFGILDNFIEKSEIGIKDSLEKDDKFNYSYYKGQKEMVEEIRNEVKTHDSFESLMRRR